MSTNLARRRMMSTTLRVATPMLSPDSDDTYIFSSDGKLSVTVTCQTSGATIHYEWYNVNGGDSESGDGQSPSVIKVSALPGDRVYISVWAEKTDWLDSETRTATYFNGSVPDSPLPTLFSSLDQYGNGWRTNSTTTHITQGQKYTPIKLLLSDAEGTDTSEIYYTVTIDGSTPPDPTNPNSNASVLRESDGSLVTLPNGVRCGYIKWPQQSIRDPEDLTLIVTAVSNNPVKIRAATKVGYAYSSIMSTQFTTAQSQLSYIDVFNSDTPTMTVGHFLARENSSGKWFEAFGDKITITNNGSVDYSTVPNYYGFAVCALNDTDEYLTSVKVSRASSGTIGQSIKTGQFYTVNENAIVRYTVTKLGCPAATITNNGKNRIHINRYIFLVNVTDTSKPILIGRSDVWTAVNNNCGNTFGQTTVGSENFPQDSVPLVPVSGSTGFTYKVPLQYNYDISNDLSDYYLSDSNHYFPTDNPTYNHTIPVRVYVNGERITTSSMSLQSYTSKISHFKNSAGTGEGTQNPHTGTTEDIPGCGLYVYYPDKTGKYCVIVSFPQCNKIWKTEKWNIVYNGSSWTKTTFDSYYGEEKTEDIVNAPTGLVYSPFRVTKTDPNTNQYQLPNHITISDGMTCISRFFFTGIRKTGTTYGSFPVQTFDFSSDADGDTYNYNDGGSTNRIQVYNTGQTLRTVGYMAFSATKPSNSGSAYTLDISKQNLISRIDDYVCFGCNRVDTSNYEYQTNVTKIVLPGNIRSIGLCLNGALVPLEATSGSGSIGAPEFQLTNIDTIPEIASVTNPVKYEGEMGTPLDVNQTSSFYNQWTIDDGDLKDWMTFGVVINNPSSDTTNYYFYKRTQYDGSIIVGDSYVAQAHEYFNYVDGKDPVRLREKRTPMQVKSTSNHDYTWTGVSDITYPYYTAQDKPSIESPFSAYCPYTDDMVGGDIIKYNKLCFSKGMLKYTGQTDNKWYLLDNQFMKINLNSSATSERAYFAFATSGIPQPAYVVNNAGTPVSYDQYYNPWQYCDGVNHHVAYGDPDSDLHKTAIDGTLLTYADWCFPTGQTRRIQNGGDGTWMTFSSDEMQHILYNRRTLNGYRFSIVRITYPDHTWISPHYEQGVILFPDNWNPLWSKDAGIPKSKVNNPDIRYNNNSITMEKWDTLLSHGAVFFVTQGRVHSGSLTGNNDTGAYWTRSNGNNSQALSFSFDDGDWISIGFGEGHLSCRFPIPKDDALGVRPVSLVKYDSLA